jgi:hypothetical protein
MSANSGFGYPHGSFQAMSSPASTAQVELGGGLPFAHSPAAVSVPGGGPLQAVHAIDSLDSIRYAVFADPSPDSTTAAELNDAANWSAGKPLAGAEGDNSETHLSSGPRAASFSATGALSPTTSASGCAGWTRR